MKMLPQRIIARKRDGFALSREEIQQFVDGVVDGTFQDYQASSLLMAIVIKGMTAEETSWMTESMMHSGRVVDLPEITRPKVDKHSTGGVGDKVSLILAPLAAACGLCVPMMSGRGLGHTGGTLDKLEAIPGFRIELSDSEYRNQLLCIHQAMIGQSDDIVPADRKLYALRDVTATVESIPLICSSILSKKMAEGIDALVLDVKFGKGAFMPTENAGRELAEALVSISGRMGKPATALLTRMDTPLGRMVGNALEVIEAIDCLRGEGPDDLMEVTYALGVEMLLLGGRYKKPDPALKALKKAIADGSALSAFRALIQAQGGDVNVLEDYERLPISQKVLALGSKIEGELSIYELDAKKIGEAAHLLGAGRSHAGDLIDPSVGIELLKKPGDRVKKGDALVHIYYNDDSNLEAVEAKVTEAFKFTKDRFKLPPLIVGRVRQA